MHGREPASCAPPPQGRRRPCAWAAGLSRGAGARRAAAHSYMPNFVVVGGRYTPKFAVADGVGEPVEEMAAVLEALAAARALAKRNAGLVVAQPTWTEKQAGIFEPPPADEEAVATTLGLLLNCINSGLYMANYNRARRPTRAPRVPVPAAQAPLIMRSPAARARPLERLVGLRRGGAPPGA